jgi:type II secretory pathway pseudopilin PulG
MGNTQNLPNKEQGFVLILALFMLSICTVIGMSSLMSSTTEVEIAGNEKVSKETFYQAESGYITAAAALIEKNAYGEWTDNFKLADLGGTGSIKIKDGGFLLEARDEYPSQSGKWNKYNQTDTVEDSPDIEIRIKNQYNLDIDVDKIGVRYIAGGAVEFAAGSEGIGVSTHRIIYNIDSIGTVAFWDSVKNRFVRNLRLADGSVNSRAPLAEVIVGYGYVPWQ